ncbi:MAG TPA: SgcJ/EcaC family oxidoreductase [Anaerolineae bacterium]|nr:SgcJ/EcaC family oxidoreductase [Anaerolineae bacterium]
MKPETIRPIIQQAAEAWITGNADLFASFFTSDGEFVVPGKIHRGREAIRQVTQSFADRYSDVKIDIRRIIIDGDQCVVEWYWEDTKKETGVRSRADDAIVVDFKNGLICRWREYIDTKSPSVT